MAKTDEVGIDASYSLGFILSIILHVGVIGSLLFNFGFKINEKKPVMVNLSENKVVTNEPIDEQKVDIVKADLVDGTLVEQEMSRLKAIEDNKIAAENLRLEKIKQERHRLQAERKRLEKEQLLADERRKKQEIARKKALEKARLAKIAKEKKAALLKKKKQEQERLAKVAAEKASKEKIYIQSEVIRYKALIAQELNSKWNNPFPLEEKLTCILELAMLPDGTVVNHKIKKSSGNTVYDESVVTAVYKASPLPFPEDGRIRDNLRKLPYKFNSKGIG